MSELSRVHCTCVHVGAVLVAQWMRPCHCPDTNTIGKQLDSIAEMVAVELLRGEEREGEREGEGDGEGEGTEGGVKRLRQSALAAVTQRGLPVDIILTALNKVLYDRLGFKGATGDAYYELDNSYIDRVRRCSACTVCI